MTFETVPMPCLACGRPGLVAEVDKGGTLFLACQNGKCGMRIGAAQAVTVRAERESRVVAGSLPEGERSRLVDGVKVARSAPARLE
ncbi:MAG: hypothetical protein LC798_13645 [Chloroflexi bacterium]|nr:hypothetical protein [Chloroflexota bacterium]